MTHSAGLRVDSKEPKAKATSLTPTWEILINSYSEWSRKSKPLVDTIVRKMEERNEYGFVKHGAYLTPNNGRDNRNDTFQEMLDSAVYVQNEIEEMKMSEDDGVSFGVRMEMLTDVLEGILNSLELYYMYSELYGTGKE